MGSAKSKGKHRGNPQKMNLDVIWNILTLLLLIGIGCVSLFYLIIFINPYQALNPLQPPIPTATVPAGFVTATPFTFPSTWTPTAYDASKAPTVTPVPADGVSTDGEDQNPEDQPESNVPTDAFVLPEPNETQETSQSVDNNYGYAFEVVTPIQAIASTFLYPGQECNWAGIGGRVMDSDGAPYISQVIQLGGFYNGETISMTALSGTQLEYGQSGYEFFLGDTPLDTKQDLWIQLLSQENVPLSDKVYLDTYSDCDKNMLVVIFRQVD